MELRLSDSFLGNKEDVMLETVARVLNVNYGYNQELMARCRRIHDYSYLIQKIRFFGDQGFELEKAINLAVKDCIDNDILREFLLKHRGKVCNVILTEYNSELHIRSEKKLSYDAGKEEGREEGIRALIEDNREEGISRERILLKLQKRFSLSQEEAQRYLELFPW